MNVGVVGGRTFNDYGKLKAMLDVLLDGFGVTTIVSGSANGADSLGEKYADERGLKKIIHIPDWKEHGRVAGMIRNKDIINDSDIVVACWDKESRGTKNSIDLAKAQNKITILIYY
jgi:hypothetical protein